VIVAVTGTPGSGKTFRLVCEIADHLSRGGYVATNVRLADDWQERLARRSLLTRFYRPARREQLLAGRFIFSEDVDELLRVQLPPPRKGEPWEGRGLWVLDEAHEALNSRTWADDSRLKVVRWLSRSRHRGWDVRLGTQHFDSLDKQLRDRCEFEELVRNMKRAQIAGLPIVPFNLFLAIRTWRGGPSVKRHVAKRSLYLLDDRRKLYDTHGLYALSAEDLDGGQPILFGCDARTGAPPSPAGTEGPERTSDDQHRPVTPVESLLVNTNGPASNGAVRQTPDEIGPRRGRLRL
jgi:hypothetical protein